MTEHDDERREVATPLSDAEHGLIQGDELCNARRYNEALMVYLKALAGLVGQEAQSPREEFIVGLLNYSIGELYRAQPQLAPHRLSARDHLALADIDDTMGGSAPQFRESGNHGLAFCVRRSMGLRDLELGISDSADTETYVATARGHLTAAETELTLHFMALAIANNDPEQTVDMQRVRESVETTDPELQEALRYLNRLDGDRARTELRLGRLSLRGRLRQPQRPELRRPYAQAGTLIRHAD